MIGHLWNDGIVHAEAALDEKLHNALRRSHALKNYPELIGDNQVFRVKDAVEAVIVGLWETRRFKCKAARRNVVARNVKVPLGGSEWRCARCACGTRT